MDKELLHKDEQIALLEKLLKSDEAIEELASMELVEMPKYLAEEILNTVLAEKISAEEVKTDKNQKIWSKWFQLFCYSAKVTFATACAIVVLFNLPDVQELQRKREPIKYEKTSYVADMFDFISEKIFDGGLKDEE